MKCAPPGFRDVHACSLDGRRIGAAFNLTRLKQPSPANNLRRLLLASTHPRTGRALSGFETHASANREARRRLKSLRGRRRHAPGWSPIPEMLDEIDALLEALAHPAGPYGVHSFADPRFLRELRRRLFGELLRLVRQLPRDQVRFYTIASESWRLAGDNLLDFSPKRLAESLRTNLARYGKLDRRRGWCITFFHNEHDAASDTWQPHFHAIVVGEKHLAFEALRSLDMFQGGEGCAVYRPIQMEPLRNAVRQVSYLLKIYFPGKTSYLHEPTGGNRRPKTHRRIPEPRHAESLLFLHRQRFADLIWLHGIEIKNRRLRVRQQRGKSR